MIWKQLLLTSFLLVQAHYLLAQRFFWADPAQWFTTATLKSPWRFAKDTAVFNSNTPLIGIAYHPQQNGASIILNAKIQNHLGEQQVVTFKAKRFDPSKLNWPAAVLQWQAALLESKHWYQFEVFPKPSVQNAYDGIALLQLFRATAVQQGAIFIEYQAADAPNKAACIIDFEQGQGHFLPLWERLAYYEQLVEQRQTFLQQQTQLEASFAPYDLATIQSWSGETQTLKSDLAVQDLALLKVVERLKNSTEVLPDSISPTLKRLLREVLLLDLTILKLPAGPEQNKKRQQKTILVRELTLYPELQPILEEYELLDDPLPTMQRAEQQTQRSLQAVYKNFKRYEPNYKQHKRLQKLIEGLDLELQVFK